MSMCSGKIYCEVYRDKKYCKNKAFENRLCECACRHAVYKCETEHGCMMQDVCSIKKGVVE